MMLLMLGVQLLLQILKAYNLWLGGECINKRWEKALSMLVET